MSDKLIVDSIDSINSTVPIVPDVFVLIVRMCCIEDTGMYTTLVRVCKQWKKWVTDTDNLVEYFVQNQYDFRVRIFRLAHTMMKTKTLMNQESTAIVTNFMDKLTEVGSIYDVLYFLKITFNNWNRKNLFEVTNKLFDVAERTQELWPLKMSIHEFDYQKFKDLFLENDILFNPVPQNILLRISLFYTPLWFSSDRIKSILNSSYCNIGFEYVNMLIIRGFPINIIEDFFDREPNNPNNNMYGTNFWKHRYAYLF